MPSASKYKSPQAFNGNLLEKVAVRNFELLKQPDDLNQFHTKNTNAVTQLNGVVTSVQWFYLNTHNIKFRFKKQKICSSN
jgi:hypothetical protein